MISVVVSRHRYSSGCFHMGYLVAVHCVNKLGSARSLPLPGASERLFVVAASWRLHLSAVHVPGMDNVWADALSRGETSSVEWSLSEDAFGVLVDLYGLPGVALFASQGNHRLPLFVTRLSGTVAGGPDALVLAWIRWKYVYVFPTPTSTVLSKVVALLESFLGRVLLLAPLWIVQPWCPRLLLWCPHPLPLDGQAVMGPGVRHSGMLSDFHAW